MKNLWKNKKMVEILKPEAFLTLKRTFLVKSPTDETVLVAINPKYKPEFRALTWWDTVKERVVVVNEMTLKDNTLSIKDVDGAQYLFTPLSLELYKSEVKSKLYNPKDFGNEEEMDKAFQETLRG